MITNEAIFTLNFIKKCLEDEYGNLFEILH
jgi:hypothetical protein